MDIPRLIHQTAPTDIKKWPIVWTQCRNSWVQVFPNFKYRMWNDEDIDEFVKKHFPQYYDMWKAYPRHIMRVDLVRYMILYEYGGIYADMDYEVFRDFYKDLPRDKVSIGESPYKENENLQNALMCSPPKHPFWLVVLEEAVKRRHINLVLYATGPQLIDTVVSKKPDYVNILPYKHFNPHKMTEEFHNTDELYTRHHGTEMW
jgi:mannosyltransferase OCH1-like enzyme